MSVHSDIIHPRNQGGGVDAEFIETWAERKAKVSPAEKPRRPYRNRLAGNADLVRRLRSLHAQGFQIKHIAAELGIGTTSVSRLIVELDLPNRIRITPKALRDWVPVSFRMDGDEYRALSRRCSTGQKSMAHFIRAAIRDRMERIG